MQEEKKRDWRKTGDREGGSGETKESQKRGSIGGGSKKSVRGEVCHIVSSYR